MTSERTGIAGSLESCDALVMVILSSGTEAPEVEIDGPSLPAFGDSMKIAALETVRSLGITGCRIRVQDRGALDCTLRARVETAARRALAGPGEMREVK